jgi:hypothetical protein
MTRAILFFFLITVLSMACTSLQAQSAAAVENKSVSTATPKYIPEATRFVVYYTGNAAADLANPDSYLRTFMDVYELQVINTFEKNEYNKGFTLQPKTLLESPNDTAKELSMVEGVMMIEIVYCKPNTES